MCSFSSFTDEFDAMNSVSSSSCFPHYFILFRFVYPFFSKFCRKNFGFDNSWQRRFQCNKLFPSQFKSHYNREEQNKICWLLWLLLVSAYSLFYFLLLFTYENLSLLKKFSGFIFVKIYVIRKISLFACNMIFHLIQFIQT